MNMPFCDGCGVPVTVDQSFCIKCGRNLQPLSKPPPRPMFGTLELSQARVPQIRPTGVSLIAAILVIGGVLDIVMAVLFLVLSASSFHIFGVIIEIPQFGFLLLLLLAIALIVSSSFSFVLAYGILKGRAWAWTWTFVSCVLNLVASVAGIVVGVGVAGLIVYPIMIYYLTRPRVRQYFGK